MDNIVIGFSTSRKKFAPLAWLIRESENIPYSHTYIRVGSDSLDRYLVYHASGTELHFSNIQRFRQHNVICKEFFIPIEGEEKIEILQYCIDNLGVPYGRMQIVGLALIQVLKLVGIKIHNPWKDGDKSQICLEFVANILKILGETPDKNLEDKAMHWVMGRVEHVYNKRRTQEAQLG